MQHPPADGRRVTSTRGTTHEPADGRPAQSRSRQEGGRGTRGGRDPGRRAGSRRALCADRGGTAPRTARRQYLRRPQHFAQRRVPARERDAAPECERPLPRAGAESRGNPRRFAVVSSGFSAVGRGRYRHPQSSRTRDRAHRLRSHGAPRPEPAARRWRRGAAPPPGGRRPARLSLLHAGPGTDRDSLAPRRSRCRARRRAHTLGCTDGHKPRTSAGAGVAGRRGDAERARGFLPCPGVGR